MASTQQPSTLDTLLKLFEERKITKHNAFEVDLQKTCEHVRYLAQTKAGFSASSSHVEAMQYVWGKKVENTKIALEQLTDKLLVRNGSNGTRGNSAKRDTEGEEPQERQRRRKKRLKDDKDLNLPRDPRSCVLDNFLLENTKERDGKIQESFMFKAPMYCGMVVGDAQPHLLFEEFVERPADPSLDLSGMLPALRETMASIDALGDNPFPQLQKWIPKGEDPFMDALLKVVKGRPVSVQVRPVPSGASRPCSQQPAASSTPQRDTSTTAEVCNSPTQHNSQSPSQSATVGLPCGANDGAAACEPNFSGTQLDTQLDASGGGFATEAAAEAIEGTELDNPWDDGVDEGFDDVGDDWGDMPLHADADEGSSGQGLAPREMSQVEQWLMQPQRPGMKPVNLSWADNKLWRHGLPPTITSVAPKTTKNAAPVRTKKVKLTSKCTGADDVEHFPPHKAGKTCQLSAKKQLEMKQKAVAVQQSTLRPHRAKAVVQMPQIDFEAQHNSIATMLADLHKPAEFKRNQRAALEDGDLDIASLWGASETDAPPLDSHDATAGYCDYDPSDAWDDCGDCGDDRVENWPETAGVAAEHLHNAAGAPAAGHNSLHSPFGAALSPLASNLMPAAKREAQKINYSRRRKPVNAGELKVCLWDSFLAHRTSQILTTPEVTSPAAATPVDTCPDEVDWQHILNDLKDGSWGKVEDSSVHMCYFLTLVLANERELRLRDAGNLELGQRIMLRQAS